MLRVNVLRAGRRALPVASDVSQFWMATRLGGSQRTRGFVVSSAHHRERATLRNRNNTTNRQPNKQHWQDNNKNAKSNSNANGTSDASKADENQQNRIRFLFGDPKPNNPRNARNNRQSQHNNNTSRTNSKSKPEDLRVISNKFTNLLSFSEPVATTEELMRSAATKSTQTQSPAAAKKPQFKIPPLSFTKTDAPQQNKASTLSSLFAAHQDKKNGKPNQQRIVAQAQSKPQEKKESSFSALLAAHEKKQTTESCPDQAAEKPKRWTIPALSLPKRTQQEKRDQPVNEVQNESASVREAERRPSSESRSVPKPKNKRLGLLRLFSEENSIFEEDDFAPIEVRQREAPQFVDYHDRRPRRRQRRFDPSEVQPNREVEIPHGVVSVTELASRMSIKAQQLVYALKELGESGLGLDSNLPSEVAELVVESLDMIPVLLPPEFVDVELTVPPEDCSAFPTRPPIVSVMGHVDHGKTTLLDALRKAKVAQDEHGGITQNIGAFSVHLGKEIDEHLRTMTFIDTPGHEAFKGMRARGSEVTDIIVLVVAADDGVCPQTVESIKLALKHKVPLVVAITKMDMHGHDPDEVTDRIGQELMKHGVAVESLGGDTPMVFVSGKTGEGLDDLKSTIALHAEMMDLRADAKADGEAIVLEATMQRGMGAAVDVIVKWGTLKQGSAVVCGLEYGKVKSLVDQNGKRAKQIGPGQPVRVLGLKGTPIPGEALLTVPSEERAREIVKKRAEVVDWEVMMASAREEDDTPRRARVVFSKQMSIKRRTEEIALQRRLMAERKAQLADEQAQREGNDANCVPIIVKADSVGSISAIDDLISCLPTEGASIKRIFGDVGAVTSSDVDMAETFGARIYSFNVNPSAAIVKEARIKNVQMCHHKVVYSMLDDIKDLLAEHLPKVSQLEVLGTAEVIQQIPISVSGRRTANVAGCKVSRGSLDMKCKYRLVRDGEIVADDLSMKSMRHFQEKVSELTKGQECGLHLNGDLDFKEGDVIEAYTVHQVKQKL